MTKRKSVCYIAGPMSSFPKDYNYPAFFYWEKELKAGGFRVVNPARHFMGIKGFPWPVYILFDLATLWLSGCTHIFMLKGWEQSTGASIEKLFAEKLGIKVLYETYPE